MDNIYLKVFFDSTHIIATITWFGAMFTNFILVSPVASDVLEAPQVKLFMQQLMKKTKVVVYISFALLFITGIPMKIINESYVSIINFSNNWQITSFIKHVFVALLGLLTLYNFEVHPRIMKKIYLNNTAEKNEKMRKIKGLTGKLSMFISFIIIILSAVMKYID